ncbi:hypothetical protein ACEQ8H_004269 [Pleosporales sp. CAS-2024a]
MAPVLVFGPTGQVGSAAAVQAAEQGAQVWLAMRDTTKQVPGLTKEVEASGDFHRVQADLSRPDSVTKAVKTSGAKRAFIYLVHGASDHLRGAIEALKAAGVEFVVFLSSFTILTKVALRDIPASDILPHIHAQVEANLDDVFGSDNYVALRAGCFITNLLSEKAGIASGNVRMYGSQFKQDGIVPSDIGKVAGTILVSGPRNGQKKVYLYGPEILSIYDGVVRIGKTLGKDLNISLIGPKEASDLYTSFGMSESYIKYLVEVYATEGRDKGDGEIFPNYEEGVSNVQLYTGKPATKLEDWVKENAQLFNA